MIKKSTQQIFTGLFGCTAAVLILSAAGCYFAKPPVSERRVLSPELKKVVVVGFRPALGPEDKPGIIINPISGAVHNAQPVPADRVQRMTDILFKRLLDEKGLDLIPPGQAEGVFSSLLSSGSLLGDREMFRKIGQAFSADAVLIGYVYRWKEREGTDYAVDEPASVAFDLYLLSAGNGAILWRGTFDKTQQALSENLFDMQTFVKGGGKWMTAEALAEIGLASLIDDMPKASPGREGQN